MKPKVVIEYCTGCRWLLRAGWMAQELLTTFEDDLDSVALRPSDTSGSFRILVDGALLWDRKSEGRFPELKEVKQALRDRVVPERELGHSDRKGEAESE